MFVRNHMTPKPHTVAPETLVDQAAGLFDEHRIRHLPVVDTGRRLVGIVTDRDVRSAVGYDHDSRVGLRIEDIMTADPVTVSENTPLEDALTVFCAHRYGALPVVTGGKLVGILTRHDVLRAMYNLLGLDRQGYRLEVALPDRKHDLAAAFQTLKESHAEIISAIASRVRDDGEEPALYVRIAGTNYRSVEAELRRAGLILLVPENEVCSSSR